MNRKYEGLVSVVILALALGGCRKAETEQNAGAEEDQVAVKVPLEGEPGRRPETNSAGGSVEPGSKMASPASPRLGGGVRRTEAPREFRRPAMPPADETVTGKYEAPGGTVAEVEGVCSIKEDSIACWDSSGRDNSDLAKRVEEALTRSDSYSGFNRLSFAYKKKNRVVITKTTQPRQSSGGNMASVYMMSIGDSQFGGGQINLDLNRRESYSMDQPHVQYSARSVSVEPSVRTTTARFQVTQMIGQVATLQLQKGASCTSGGAKLTIVSIKKGTDVPGRRDTANMGYYGGDSGPKWTIHVKVTGNKGKTYHSLNAQGYIDEKGKYLTQEEYSKEMMRMSEAARKPGAGSSTSMRMPNIRNVFLSPMSAPMSARSNGAMPSDFYYVVNADPAAIKRVSVTSHVSKQVEMKGIRLDPR